MGMARALYNNLTTGSRRRLHDHAAVCGTAIIWRHHLVFGQDSRGHTRDEDREFAGQAAGAVQLHEHDLPGPRRIRHTGGGESVLRQGGERPHRGRGGDDRPASSRHRACGTGGERGAGQEQIHARDRHHARRRLHHRPTGQRGEVPRDEASVGEQRPGPGRTATCSPPWRTSSWRARRSPKTSSRPADTRS